jgi:hypothetical protein
MSAGEWGLVPEDGGPSLSFTSIISIDVRSEGKALTEPVERNGFAAYNKIESPKEVNCALSTMGTAADAAATLEALETLKRDCVKVVLSTPSATYDNLTLESYSYSRKAESGAYVLFVDCSLKEVREVDTNVSTTVMTKESCKNSDSASKQGTGKAGTEETEKPKRSILRDATGRGD